MSALALQSFGFNEQLVRVVDRDGGIWFVAKDVCTALEISNHKDAVSRLEADERDGVGITDPIGRSQTVTVISESGLYALIFRSRKPVAVQFRKWVTQEVLPAIRRTGAYQVPANDAEAEAVPPEELDAGERWRTGLQLVREARIVGGRAAARRAWEVAGLPDVFSAPETPVLLPMRGMSPDAQQVSEWIGERCELAPGHRFRSRDLYADYEAWCAATERQARGPLVFGKTLTALGFCSLRSDGCWRIGLKLKE